MPGYHVDRKDWKIGKGGGVLLYVKNTLTSKQLEGPENIKFDSVGVEINFSNEMSFILNCMYRHPTTKVVFFDQLKSLLNSSDSNKETIILSDLNANWDDKKGRKNLKTNYWILQSRATNREPN